jgi:hypothetical protein
MSSNRPRKSLVLVYGNACLLLARTTGNTRKRRDMIARQATAERLNAHINHPTVRQWLAGERDTGFIDLTPAVRNANNVLLSGAICRGFPSARYILNAARKAASGLRWFSIMTGRAWSW